MEAKTIGFIGLGIMGAPMSGHLMKAGHKVIAYDVVPAAIERVVGMGATAGASPQAVAAQSDVVISMVPDSPDVEKVYLAEDGVLAGAKPGTLLLDMSTISPVTAQKVAEEAAKKGCPMLDAPVSGGEVGAKEATLSIMVGGDPQVFEQAVPILEVMGKPTYCGASGAGQTVKACNQIQVAMNFIGMAEALVLGAKAGVDPEIIIKVLSAGYAQTRVMDVRGPRALQGDYAPGFKARFHYKDLNIIRETARAYGASLPASALAHELFTAMIANGWGELDHSAVVKVIEKLSNAEVPVKR
ncbi:MAG TPA: 2-hydroxy-3-oxopropionate reductase [Chloroflexi bacterium]|jgi:2-hydroxy-3-oxopropionate reductase|nr:2-hydroxy-3-oxopropionate reductase [Chloroflexota bacterium]